MVHFGLYCKMLKNVGTEIHHEYLMRGVKCQDLGCFALTELGHGSNVQGIETTAHYDVDTQGYILHSPTVTSKKFWIGNLAKTAKMAVVFAQLILPNGKNVGPNAFLVQI